MTQEYTEQQKWAHFWGGLNGCDKGGSILRSFFMQLYAFDDYGGNRNASYKIHECTALNIPEVNNYNFTQCVFRLDVESLVPGNDRFRIHTHNMELDDSKLILPVRDLRLVYAVDAGFSDWSFTNNCFIPQPIFERVTLPIKELEARLKANPKP